MPTNPVDLLKELQALLREGKVQEVDNAITAAIATAPPTTGAQLHGVPATSAPRPAPVVIQELFTAIVSHLGNHPALRSLVEELAATAAEL
jgi:hypothetical protein